MHAAHNMHVVQSIAAWASAGHGLVADIIDTSQEEGSLVAPGVSLRLDQLKAAYHALPGLLTRVVEAELARIPRALSHSLSQQTWTCIYLPQARARRSCRERNARPSPWSMMSVMAPPLWIDQCKCTALMLRSCDRCIVNIRNQRLDFCATHASTARLL